MSTHNIHFYDNIGKVPKPLNSCFLELKEEFPRESQTSSNQPRYTNHYLRKRLFKYIENFTSKTEFFFQIKSSDIFFIFLLKIWIVGTR